MAKIVLQNQTSPTTPECGFTAMYVNCITWLPTFKRDDWTECSFLLACEWHWIEWMMAECVYDPNCIGSDVFAMDNMQQGTCKQYVTCDEKTCWNNKVDCCDIPDMSEVAKCCDIPTDVCQLCNSCNYITNAVDNLCNYFLKCDVYQKCDIDEMINNFWWFEVVTELPTTDIKTNIIYMKWPIGTGSDRYEEWIYSNNTWTLIGETSVDLSNYAQCCDIPSISNLAQCCDIPDISNKADCSAIPDVSNLAQCCDIPDTSNLAQCCDIPSLEWYAQTCDIPTDNCQLTNGCGYTKCKGNMMKCIYDPNNCAVDVYCMENMVDGTTKVAMTTAERTKLCGISWCNTWDETCSTIKCKLGITTLSWCNTWDETCSTIKCKLWAASCADDWYLKSCDFTKFINKQDELISWCNIITINGCTILRCADICICNSGWDMKACVYDPYGCCTDMFNRANHYWCMSYANVTWLWSSATRDIWTNCWNVVVVQNDWKISSDVLPAQDVVDVCVFCSEADMLAWSTANRWDMAIRTDIARTYVMSGSWTSCIDSWTILPVPSSPVTSVNGCIGDVCLDTDDISDTNSSKKYVTAAEKACWCGKADPYVSWCTIKTINGCSVLGCWDICIPNTITCVNGKTGNVCLTADDISDTWTWHLFVSQTEKNCWNCKINCEDAIVDNCQLCNGCWYITNAALCNYAQCCDIPDVSNFICACDIANKADCCDIPSISWLLQECCVATINWCCLTCWWDICIQAWEWAEWVRESIPAWCCTYTLCTPPVNKSWFMVFVDSWLGMLPTNDYTYNILTCTLTFCNALACNETAKVWIMKQWQASWGWGWCAEWWYIWWELCDQADLQCALWCKANACDLNWLAKECDIACINGCCLLCTWNICIKWWDYWWCDYIHNDQSCCICPEHQLIIEWTLTIDWELINDWKIYII